MGAENRSGGRGEVTRIVPEVTHNLERKEAVINLGRGIASLQTDNVPAGAKHVLLRCSNAQTTKTLLFFLILRVIITEK